MNSTTAVAVLNSTLVYTGTTMKSGDLGVVTQKVTQAASLPNITVPVCRNGETLGLIRLQHPLSTLSMAFYLPMNPCSLIINCVIHQVVESE